MDFCTLFDRNYLIRGLVLIESLSRLAPGSTVWVLCLDGETCEILRALAIPTVVTIPFEQIDDERLRLARRDRTREEVAWTCTPILPRHILRTHPQIDYLCYVDADIMFFRNPAALVEELAAGSILIFEHGFPPDRQHIADEMGRFNVEVIVFRNDANADACLQWWTDRCLEWCYHRVQPGRMGDQKYLDAWPNLFSGVVIAGRQTPGLAPWNMRTYTMTADASGSLLVSGVPVLFVHFSKLSVLGWSNYRLCNGYEIPVLVNELAYVPYTRELTRQWGRVRAIVPGFDGDAVAEPPLARLCNGLRGLRRRLVRAPARVWARGTVGGRPGR